MKTIKEYIELIEKISDKNSSTYVNLPNYFRHFQYPISLELSRYIGRKAYQEESIDSVEFLCVLANKIYNNIQAQGKADILSSFIVNEKDVFKEKISELITSAKRWENGTIDDVTFGSAIEKFCLKTYGIRLPVVSFFLRMVLPHKFGTLDVRAISALKSIGFIDVKNIPADETIKEEYFRKFSGFDYLQYNTLLKEIGSHYEIRTENGLKRGMLPCEVDMALYTFDKSKSRPTILKTNDGEKFDKIRNDKIIKIMNILKEIEKDAIDLANEDWAKKAKTHDGKIWSGKISGSVNELMRNMNKLANNGDLEGILNYYTNALGSENGKLIGSILKEKGRKSLESEYGKVMQIYS